MRLQKERNRTNKKTLKTKGNRRRMLRKVNVIKEKLGDMTCSDQRK
jgi:hypothetical protein